MASSALNVLSGIAAAAAGLAGDKVAKNGTVPGLDLASLLPALLGKTGGSGSNLIGTLASVASKTGLLKSGNLGNLASLAGSLLSVSGSSGTKKTATEGIAGLAAMVVGNSGSGADLGGIASLAAKLASTAKDDKAVTGLASTLGKTLSSSFGVSFSGASTALKALGKSDESDTKTSLFTTILKSLG